MPSRTPLHLMTLAAGLAMTCGAARAGAWDDAQNAFAERDDRAGIVHLRRAADEGDPRAVRAYGLALRYGERLFPGALRADPAQAVMWLARAQPPGVDEDPTAPPSTLVTGSSPRADGATAPPTRSAALPSGRRADAARATQD